MTNDNVFMPRCSIGPLDQNETLVITERLTNKLTKMTYFKGEIGSTYEVEGPNINLREVHTKFRVRRAGTVEK